MENMAKKFSPTLAVYSLTLLLSATITFTIQPLVGKMLLPIVGGTPAGWIVAMAFFQIMLLVGYLIAHILSKLSLLAHALVYMAGIVAGLLFLPLNMAGHSYAESPQAMDVFLLLTATVGFPFIALSATSSTLQRLFTTTTHSAANDPYFLYAASNLGSLFGLLVYPLVLEPLFTLPQQQSAIRGVYVLLLALAAACVALCGKKKSAVQDSAPSEQTALSAGQRIKWLALSFLPSSLLLGVTMYITTNIISAPMIWILPLALYLVTFILAFSRKHIIPLTALDTAHPYIIASGIFFISLVHASWLGSWTGVVFCLLVFSGIALACHTRLAETRPTEKHLTDFYLMMSIGGALGGLLNAFIIPVIFNTLAEFPLMLLASYMLHPDFDIRSKRSKIFASLLALSFLLVNVPVIKLGFDSVLARVALTLALIFSAMVLLAKHYRTIRQPSVLALISICVFMLSQYVIGDQSQITASRNFYGTIRLIERQDTVEGKKYPLRVMFHGSTIHGTEIMTAPLDTEPTAYYAKEGPLGDVFSTLQPKSVAVLGLGAGATNCYAAKDRHFTFLEIDPAVVAMAKDYFHFLSRCSTATAPNIILGDGRLELAKLEHEKFNLLIVDVFTSDSIPTHIITREALAMYLDRLAQGGVIAVNISNRYFALWDMIAETGAALGLETSLRAKLDGKFENRSIWLVLARKGEMPPLLAAKPWWQVPVTGATRAWTDDYSNLLGLLSPSVVRRLMAEEHGK